MSTPDKRESWATTEAKRIVQLFQVEVSVNGDDPQVVEIEQALTAAYARGVEACARLMEIESDGYYVLPPRYRNYWPRKFRALVGAEVSK